MYNDTIKVANKIISDVDLLEIFQRMDEEIKENEQLCKQETIQNERLDDDYQNWTVKNFEGVFRCTINFYDDTNVTIDNYTSFITTFNNRIHEIKDMWIRYHYGYWIQHGREQKLISQHINMTIYENKMDIEVCLSSEDNKMDDVYQLIKEKILNAPERYNRVIKKRGIIKNKIAFALGIIPSLIICSLLVFVPVIRQIYGTTYILYPIISILLAFLIGNTFCTISLNRLYSTIIPKQTYAGWDSSKHKSVYKDDIKEFTSSSEIIIGKNVNNLSNRKKIVELEEKYSKYILVELLIILGLSVIMIILGKI